MLCATKRQTRAQIQQRWKLCKIPGNILWQQNLFPISHHFAPANLPSVKKEGINNNRLDSVRWLRLRSYIHSFYAKTCNIIITVIPPLSQPSDVLLVEIFSITLHIVYAGDISSLFDGIDSYTRIISYWRDFEFLLSNRPVAEYSCSR